MISANLDLVTRTGFFYIIKNTMNRVRLVLSSFRILSLLAPLLAF